LEKVLAATSVSPVSRPLSLAGKKTSCRQNEVNFLLDAASQIPSFQQCFSITAELSVKLL